MTRSQFVDLVTDIAGYYERKAPNDRAMDIWFEKVRNVPSESIEWIEAHIQDCCESFPRNLPSMIWSSYQEWLNANPDKRASTKLADCKYCEHGWIYVAKEVEDLKYRADFSFRCGHCKQIQQPQSIPFATQPELKAKGYISRKVIPDHDKPFKVSEFTDAKAMDSKPKYTQEEWDEKVARQKEMARRILEQAVPF